MIEFKKYKTKLLQFNFDLYRRKAGIYRIINNINNKCYIGQSINLTLRIQKHISCSRLQRYDNVLYKAIRKYGVCNFSIEILTILPMHDRIRENLDLCEKIYIQIYNSYKNGYNCTRGGNGCNVGHKKTEQQLINQSLATKGVKKNPMCINHMCKDLYMYNYVNGDYFIVSSAYDGEEMLKCYGYEANKKCIQDCARGVLHTTKQFVCAYSIEELYNKINWVNENKSKKIIKFSGFTN